MKKLFLVALTLCCATMMYAQSFDPVGTWEGTLNVGVELRIVFHIKDGGDGKFSASADSPDQSAFNLPVDSVYFDGKNISLFMNAMQASFTGNLASDSLIIGEFKQGTHFPLQLRKVNAVKTRFRPQTPQPPYPYKEEKIIYENADKSIRFGATLTIPEGKGPFPAVVLISGSGGQNRNSSVLGHEIFQVLADHLTRNGLVVLRYDERGIGESTGTFQGSTSEDFARDVHTAVDQLLLRPEVNRKKIGLIGHSEGGMIAPMVATARKDITFLILLAAPGVPNLDLMTLQNEAIARSSGMPEIVVKEVAPLYRGITQSIIQAENNEQARTNAEAFLKNWTEGKDATVLAFLGLSDDNKRTEYVSSMTDQLRSPWFLFFTRYDPGPALEKLQGKVLALNGTRDLQVVHTQNLPGIEASLKKSKVKSYVVKEIPGLNHLFQTCNTCTLQEYGNLDESFSPIALNLISEWINREIK